MQHASHTCYYAHLIQLYLTIYDILTVVTVVTVVTVLTVLTVLRFRLFTAITRTQKGVKRPTTSLLHQLTAKILRRIPARLASCQVW